MWNLTGNDITKPILLEHEGGRANCAAISSDGQWLFTGSRDGKIRRYDLTAPGSGEESFMHTGGDAILSIAVSEDGRWLAATAAHWARLWDLTAANLTAKSIALRGHKNAVNSVAISPDNRWLVTGSRDSTARLWNLTAKDPNAASSVLHGHMVGFDVLVSISPDSRWLFTASWGRQKDPIARLWDLTTDDPAETPIVLRGHERGITSVAFSPSSDWVVTGGSDGTARVWNLRLHELVQLARATAGRELNEDERALYMLPELAVPPNEKR